MGLPEIESRPGWQFDTCSTVKDIDQLALIARISRWRSERLHSYFLDSTDAHFPLSKKLSHLSGVLIAIQHGVGLGGGDQLPGDDEHELRTLLVLSASCRLVRLHLTLV